MTDKGDYLKSSAPDVVKRWGLDKLKLVPSPDKGKCTGCVFHASQQGPLGCPLFAARFAERAHDEHSGCIVDGFFIWVKQDQQEPVHVS